MQLAPSCHNSERANIILPVLVSDRSQHQASPLSLSHDKHLSLYSLNDLNKRVRSHHGKNNPTRFPTRKYNCSRANPGDKTMRWIGAR